MLLGPTTIPPLGPSPRWHYIHVYLPMPVMVLFSELLKYHRVGLSTYATDAAVPSPPALRTPLGVLGITRLPIRAWYV